MERQGKPLELSLEESRIKPHSAHHCLFVIEMNDRIVQDAVTSRGKRLKINILAGHYHFAKLVNQANQSLMLFINGVDMGQKRVVPSKKRRHLAAPVCREAVDFVPLVLPERRNGRIS